MKPDDPESYSRLVGALYKKGDYKQAVKYGLTAVKIGPNNFDAHVILALAFEKGGGISTEL